MCRLEILIMSQTLTRGGLWKYWCLRKAEVAGKVLSKRGMVWEKGLRWLTAWVGRKWWRRSSEDIDLVKWKGTETTKS